MKRTYHWGHDRKGGFLPMAVLMLGLTDCTGSSWLAAEEKMMLTLGSSAFTEGAEIPSQYTCEGEDIAPPLEWVGVPDNTQSLVLIIDDPDAPDPKAPRMTWVHWVVYNLPSDINGLPAGATSRDLPAGTAEGLNDWKKVGYRGPCPPVGRHRYFHKLYALDTTLTITGTPTKAMIEAAMQGHIITQAELVGTYRKSR